MRPLSSKAMSAGGGTTIRGGRIAKRLPPGESEEKLKAAATQAERVQLARRMYANVNFKSKAKTQRGPAPKIALTQPRDVSQKTSSSINRQPMCPTTNTRASTQDVAVASKDTDHEDHSFTTDPVALQSILQETGVDRAVQQRPATMLLSTFGNNGEREPQPQRRMSLMALYRPLHGNGGTGVLSGRTSLLDHLAPYSRSSVKRTTTQSRLSLGVPQANPLSDASRQRLQFDVPAASNVPVPPEPILRSALKNRPQVHFAPLVPVPAAVAAPVSLATGSFAHALSALVTQHNYLPLQEQDLAQAATYSRANLFSCLAAEAEVQDTLQAQMDTCKQRSQSYQRLLEHLNGTKTAPDQAQQQDSSTSGSMDQSGSITEPTNNKSVRMSIISEAHGEDDDADSPYASTLAKKKERPLALHNRKGTPPVPRALRSVPSVPQPITDQSTNVTTQSNTTEPVASVMANADVSCSSSADDTVFEIAAVNCSADNTLKDSSVVRTSGQQEAASVVLAVPEPEHVPQMLSPSPRRSNRLAARSRSPCSVPTTPGPDATPVETSTQVFEVIAPQPAFPFSPILPHGKKSAKTVKGSAGKGAAVLSESLLAADQEVAQAMAHGAGQVAGVQRSARAHRASTHPVAAQLDQAHTPRACRR